MKYNWSILKNITLSEDTSPGHVTQNVVIQRERERERGSERGVLSLFAFSPKFHLCLPPFPQMHLLLRLADSLLSGFC